MSLSNFSIEYGDTQSVPISNLAIELNAVGAQVYGVETALSVEILTNWLQTCPQGFYFLRSESTLAGYLYAMPITKAEYDASLDSEYDERTLYQNEFGSAGVEKPYRYYLFSSLVVAPQFRETTPASLLLRLAFLRRLIQWSDSNSLVCISAQALSRNGESCAQSLMMEKVGITSKNWIIYNAVLSNEQLLFLEDKFQKKKLLKNVAPMPIRKGALKS